MQIKTTNKLVQVSGTGPTTDFIVLETLVTSEVLQIDVCTVSRDNADATVQLVFSQSSVVSEDGIGGVSIYTPGTVIALTGTPQWSIQFLNNGLDLGLLVDYLYTTPLVLDVDIEWVVRRFTP